MVEGGKDFRTLQSVFTAHIRDPENNAAPPGIEERRVAVYRELLYKNIERFMSNSFPVLRSITPDAQWHAMMRRYFAQHRAQTPLFSQMPKEFLRYLADSDAPPIGPAFVEELAHYESLEREALLDVREISDEPVSETANCFDDVPVLNPIARVHAYAFDVHRIGPGYQPYAPPAQRTYLVVYRDRNDAVGFMELNEVTARLVALIMQGLGLSGRVMLEQIAAEMRHPDPGVVIAGGRAIMEELISKDVLVGAR